MSYEPELDLLKQLVEHENIRASLKQSVKMGLITGISTLIGGLVAGKSGAVAGGAIATVASGFMSTDFVSVIHIIRYEMSDAERKRLLENVRSIIMKMPGPATLWTILNNETLKNGIVSLLRSAISNAGYTMS